MIPLLSVLLLATPPQPVTLDDAEVRHRIDASRKGSFEILLVDREGNPLRHREVSYRLDRLAFPVGTCISTEVFNRSEDDPDRQKYLEILSKYFTCAVHENALKWYSMEHQQGQFDDETPLKIWDWCHEHQIDMRGHCIFWGVGSFVQPWIKALGPLELEAAMKSRAQRVTSLFKGKISEFDLNNEMIHGDAYAEVLGWKNGAEYFKWVHAMDPDLTLYVNDYNILSGFETDKYVAHIQDLIDSGARVGGIGCQGHFGGEVPPNEAIWAKLDTLSRFNLPIKITEFDLTTKDEAKQAEDLKRFYRLCFAHPAVKGILMWGFWEKAHWRPEAALWRSDWSIKPAGEAFVDLVTQEWTTEGREKTGGKGRIKFQGFYGRYSLECDGMQFEADLGPQAGEVQLTPR